MLRTLNATRYLQMTNKYDLKNYHKIDFKLFVQFEPIKIYLIRNCSAGHLKLFFKRFAKEPNHSSRTLDIWKTGVARKGFFA